MKVLVADDDVDQLAIRCMLLERSGFETLPASDAATALTLARTDKPHCAVVDLRFPDEKSGLRLVRDLKEIDPGVRLVLLTGSRSAALAGRPGLELVDEIVEKGSGSARLIHALKGFAPAH